MDNLKHALHFFKKFLHRPRHVGAVLPSSGILARAMIADLHLRAGDGILELGPGTGPFTKALARVLPDPRQYLAIDRELSFIALLQKKFPTLRFVHGQAEDMHQIWQKHMTVAPRVVLSALPFANFDEILQDEILKSLVAVAAPGTVFRTFQYALTFRTAKARHLRQKMAEVFGPEQSRRLVWRNLFPAYVLSWVRRA